MSSRPTSLPGFGYHPGLLDSDEQAALLAEIEAVIAEAPLYRPEMPVSGKPFSIRMTNCGAVGWVSSRAGYRYTERHPVTGDRWPPIPSRLIDLWAEQAGYGAPPECCLVNYYEGPKARMGLHQDSDEEARDAPVMSVSLGDTAIFRIGGRRRGDPTRSLRLSSGDVVLLGGEARGAYHGVDRVLAGSSRLIPDGGRINLTLRRVSVPRR